jgi:hypothetical protein
LVQFLARLRAGNVYLAAHSLYLLTQQQSPHLDPILQE